MISNLLSKLALWMQQNITLQIGWLMSGTHYHPILLAHQHQKFEMRGPNS